MIISILLPTLLIIVIWYLSQMCTLLVVNILT